MTDILRIFRIASYSMKTTLTRPKPYIILILSFMYTHFMLKPVKLFAGNVHIGVCPYLFPFLMASNYSVKIFLLLVILLFCNAPFIDQAQLYIAIRATRRTWCAGQVLYILLLSGLYTLFLAGSTVLVMIPELTVEVGWGKVICTLAQNGVAASHGIPLLFDYGIILQYSPAMAMLLEVLLCLLIFFLFGCIIFTFNMTISPFAGTTAAVALLLFQMIAEEISPVLTFFSPASWTSLSYLGTSNTSRYPGVGYAITALLLLGITLFSISVVRVKKLSF